MSPNTHFRLVAEMHLAFGSSVVYTIRHVVLSKAAVTFCFDLSLASIHWMLAQLLTWLQGCGPLTHSNSLLVVMSSSMHEALPCLISLLRPDMTLVITHWACHAAPGVSSMHMHMHMHMHYKQGLVQGRASSLVCCRSWQSASTRMAKAGKKKWSDPAGSCTVNCSWTWG